MNKDDIDSLKKVLKSTPENFALRMLLANGLMINNLTDEAEQEYKTVLEYSPDNLDGKIGLAKACFKQNKYSMADVLLEEICREESASADCHILYAKILVKDKLKDKAKDHYDIAREKNKGVRDEDLERELNIAGPVKQSYEVKQPISIDLDFPEKSTVTFKDVGGMEDVKDEIRIKIIHPITHRDLYKTYGKKTGGGILMYGPPGCGKTFMAKATAGEVNAKFINVGINEILDMYLGETEKNIHKIFELARLHTPCVLFFDEVDALAMSRERMHSVGSQAINQFLSELDGVEHSNEGILILAATNAPWNLDAAFRRPGRFDDIIFVPPPDETGREAILNLYLKGKPVDQIDSKDIATKTKEFSGADLRSLVDHVIEEKLRASFKSGVAESITQQDLLRVLPTRMASTRDWLSTAKNYALFANQSGIYTGILDYLNKH